MDTGSKSTGVFVTLGLLAAWSLCDVNTAQAQTVINPGFESGFTGWTYVVGSPTVPPVLDTTLAHSGTNSAEFSQDHGGSDIEQEISVSAPTGTVFHESFWYMMPTSESVAGKGFEAWLFPTGANPADYTDIVYPNAAPGWTFETLTMTTVTPVTSVTMYFDTQHGGGGSDPSAFAHLDDITLTATTPSVPEPTAIPLALITGIGMLTTVRRIRRRKAV